MTDLADIVSSAFWRVNPPDADPVETREWLEAFDALVESEGRDEENDPGLASEFARDGAF